MIVGFAGFAGSGKDTAALELIRQGWERRAFADPLKEIAARIGWDGEKNDAGRKLLQDLGLAAREVLGEDVWIDATLGDSVQRALLDSVVVTDVRYWNEAAAIADADGVLVWVSRDGTEPALGHQSETDLLDWPFDWVIENRGTVDELHGIVRDLINMELG